MCVKLPDQSPRLSPSHARDPSRATRCALLGALTTPEWSQPGLGWPAVRSTYVSCLPAEISFLSLSLFGVGGLVVFSSRSSVFSWTCVFRLSFRFCFASNGSLTLQFSFHFLDTKNLSRAKGVGSLRTDMRNVGNFRGCGGVRGNSNGKWANILVCLLFI